MIIYELIQKDMEAETYFTRHWAKSKADVARIKAKVRAEYRANGNQKDFDGWLGPFKHEIGNGKDGLVRFLNIHCNKDG